MYNHMALFVGAIYFLTMFWGNTVKQFLEIEFRSP